MVFLRFIKFGLEMELVLIIIVFGVGFFFIIIVVVLLVCEKWLSLEYRFFLFLDRKEFLCVG